MTISNSKKSFMDKIRPMMVTDPGGKEDLLEHPSRAPRNFPGKSGGRPGSDKSSGKGRNAAGTDAALKENARKELGDIFGDTLTIVLGKYYPINSNSN